MFDGPNGPTGALVGTTALGGSTRTHQGASPLAHHLTRHGVIFLLKENMMNMYISLYIIWCIYILCRYV